MSVLTSLTELINGLVTDTKPEHQPKNTYRFALNTVNTSYKGNKYIRSNEEANSTCTSISPGFIPIGKCYIGNNETVIFSVSKNNLISEIGILDNDCNYTIYVNDENSLENDKLGFKVEHQIQAIYRLRRGCEVTVYWTDNNTKPKYFNFSKQSDFKSNGLWSGKKFNLLKSYDNIPEFQKIEVFDSGGNIPPGSINISIRYVDTGLNTTDWITTSHTINIYNKLLSEDYLNIQGSIKSTKDYLLYPNTSKSIKITLTNFDETFPYYQLAFIEATNGSGNVSTVKYSDIIPISKNYFIYTGDNVSDKGTEADILFQRELIEKVGSIEQIENRLILANTEGSQIDFCRLQKYASKIKTDCVLKKVLVNNLQDPRNTKNPTVAFGDMLTGGIGYMPGEIYSFGIVYVFPGGVLSPVYHIPGKSPNANPNTIYKPGDKVYPMSNDNQSQNNRYIDNNSCKGFTYWGLDSEGKQLNGNYVRHHRFPLRSSINVPLVEEEKNMGGGEQTFPYFQLRVQAVGDIELPIVCTDEEIENGSCTPVDAPEFYARIEYTVSGESDTMDIVITPNNITENPINIIQTSNIYTTNNIIINKVVEINEFNVETIVPDNTVSPKGLKYQIEIINASTTIEGKIYSTHIFGVQFSGIELPSLNDTNGIQPIGYYIVRNERTEMEKTILDSAVLTQSLINNKYISHGLLNPEVNNKNKISKKVFGLIHPEYKFRQHEYTNYDKIIQEGNFNIINVLKSKYRYNDVFEGSSYNRKQHKSGNDDGKELDGWCLKTIVRDNITEYKKDTSLVINKNNVENQFYLNAVQSRDINDGENTVYNISSDNKIGILQTKTDIDITEKKLPYVLFVKDAIDPYSNFRSLPYYKDSINMHKSDSVQIYGGDSYVSPMRYTNTLFWDNRIAYRKRKSGSIFKYILGGLLIAAGAALLLFGGSGTLVIGTGIGVIGAGALSISSGITYDAITKAYAEEYPKGLRETALDDWVNDEYKIMYDPRHRVDSPSDDEIQWITDNITDLWFESQINISLRHKIYGETPSFLDSPGIIETGNQTQENLWEFFGTWYWSSLSRYPVSKLESHSAKKLLVYNSEKKDNRDYIGYALGEFYELNPDYMRYNKQKIYYHLPIEYDCCSDCTEKFPHRVYYSEQSFQEELIDNYRIFLPNNYRDIDGETGEITNIFKIGNNLFIHTREALWNMPRNYQERVTDQLISFIGTGSYFEIPPQKIIDDTTGNSAGCQHKWSTLKTLNGVFFVSENQRKIYQFDGSQLKPISEIGNSAWFKNNIGLKSDEQYYKSKQESYIYKDNPSNPFGSGFISTYDTTKERILFTKKDFLLSDEIIGNGDFEICVKNGNLIVFPNFDKIIFEKNEEGWNYKEIDTDCRLVFEKQIIKQKIEQREINGILTNVTINYLDTDYIYINGNIIDNPLQLNSSWTMSYSLEQNCWLSWHSYLPSFYIHIPEKFYSWINNDNNLWLHNQKNLFNTFYGKKYPWIIEYISLPNITNVYTWEYLTLYLETIKWFANNNEYANIDNVFFNKTIMYNSKQCSGLMNIKIKGEDDYENYLMQQITNYNEQEIIANKDEKHWNLNNMRDLRIDYNKPIFKSGLVDIQKEYFIDKVLDETTINYDKNWNEMQFFRDKYLAIRLIFDKFVDTKLLLNFSAENEIQSK